MSALPINRGEGSRREPLEFGRCGQVRNVFRRRLTAIAVKFGECWVNFTDGTNGECSREIAAMFEEGLVVPIPRIAKQPRHFMRYQVTGVAEERYGADHGRNQES